MNYLEYLLKKTYKATKGIKKGKPASYIPALAQVDPNIYGISIVDCSGNLYSIGDHKKTVAIESIGKLFTFAMALKKHGMDALFNKIGMHGSFLPFNSVIAAQLSKSHTINPFLNQGAMATTSLLYQKNHKRFKSSVLNNMREYANRNLTLGKRVYASESATNQHNKALAYLLKSYNRFYGNVEASVDVYTAQGSLKVSSDDLAIMGSVFANGGTHPITKKKFLTPGETSYAMRTLLPEGLYEYSDRWIIKAGRPAKSGVGGGLVIVIPGMCAIGIVSPPLDRHGNSVRGIAAGIKLVNKLSLHPFNNLEWRCEHIHALTRRKKTHRRRPRKRKTTRKRRITRKR